MTIKKTGKGYQVKSQSGKNLSKPNLTKSQAERRLQNQSVPLEMLRFL